MVDQATAQNQITGAASNLFSSMDWLFPVQDNATPQERRTYKIATVGMPAALIFHILFIFLFAYWDIPALALFNILSVLIWSLCIFLMRKNQANLAFAVAAVELVVHQALVIYFVGLGMGMQYYIIVSMVTIVLSSWSLWSRVAATLIQQEYQERHCTVQPSAGQ